MTYVSTSSDQTATELFTSLQAALAGLSPITLDEISAVALLDRTETKFLMMERSVLGVLADVAQDYWLLSFGPVRLYRYLTLYFDTGNFDLYKRHQAGGRNRFKVRSRKYLDSNLSFFEVKQKVRENRTIKHRLQTADFLTQRSALPNEFVADHLPDHAKALEPRLWNDYFRITLASLEHQERVTLDFGLTFRTATEATNLRGVAVAEVKQERWNSRSPFIQAMRARGYRPTGFSKYCIGVSMLYDGVKHNAFKPGLREMSKVSMENYHA